MAEDKKVILTWDAVLKYAVYLVLAGVCYASINSKIDSHGTTLQRIEEGQKEDRQEAKREKEKWDLQKQTIQTQINTCNLEISLIKQQLEDRKNAK